MKYFAVWDEKEKTEATELTSVIENALYWYEIRDVLQVYLKMIPIDADIIQAKDYQDAREKFAEYKKRREKCGV
jgi:hypothetical protein